MNLVPPDFHPDDFYRPYSSTARGVACHRRKGVAGYYGAETSACDSPWTLVNATLDWIKANLADDIDFVVWTGDSARHDSDKKITRTSDEVLGSNRRISDLVFDAFQHPGHEDRMTIPVVPNIGNNDFLPHNTLYPGPNNWLNWYADIWRHFIPFDQQDTFKLGGWFSVEVVPNSLAVLSLNTMYMFDRNSAVDGCAVPSEPGYKHMEWLRVELQRLRDRRMKAILIGHVPPARTDSKHNWDETCWHKYNLWLRQFRDVIVGSFYGHMNIDHFLVHDTEAIDMHLVKGVQKAGTSPSPVTNKLVKKSNYLLELREKWSDIPEPTFRITGEDYEDTDDPSEEDFFEHDTDTDIDTGGDDWDGEEDEDDNENEDEDDSANASRGRKGKKGKKRKKKEKGWGGKFAERFHLSFISPSVIPNYFPTLRVYEYNITGLEDAPVWADAFQPSEESPHPVEDQDALDEFAWREELKRHLDTPDTTGKTRHKRRKQNPGNPRLTIPDPPSESSPPGPAYSPQPLTLVGYTQYFANLTYINNNVPQNLESESDEMNVSEWRSGKPEPKPFEFEVEYSTFSDKIYKLSDLTVRSYVKLAYRIAQHVSSTQEFADDFEEDDEEEGPEDDVESDLESDLETGASGKKGKKKKKKQKKPNKVWLHFLRHAFVNTVPKEKLKKL